MPWLLMTGTHDTSPIGGQTVKSRLAVFPALPPGDKYELVLDSAEHSAFTHRRLPGRYAVAQPEPSSGHPCAEHRVLGRLSTRGCRCQSVARQRRLS
ncbi:MAG: hypothetical protein EA424_11055 [Planctomycetaceae bacterium]|nr:MAG: hypothetical protein EA424_11055 [Planctomycetaceae bacterium]